MLNLNKWQYLMSIIKNAVGLAACVLMFVTGLVYAQDVKAIDTPSV